MTAPEPALSTPAPTECRRCHQPKDTHDWGVFCPDSPTRSRWVLIEDDPRFGMQAGDVLVCEPYWLDPDEKLTVLYRESDHYDPSCNVYRSQVRPL